MSDLPELPIAPEGEPVLVRSAVAVVMMLLTDALVASGVHMSASWTAVVTAAVNLLILAGLAYVIRRGVFSPATVASIIAAARKPAPVASSPPASIVSTWPVMPPESGPTLATGGIVNTMNSTAAATGDVPAPPVP